MKRPPLSVSTSSTAGSATARALVTTAAFVVVVAGMRAAAPILVPVLLAVFISIICAPLLQALTQRRVPVVLAVAVIVLALIGVGSAVAALVGSSLVDFSDQFPVYQARLQEVIQHLLVQSGVTQWPGYDETLLPSVDPSTVVGMATSVLTGLGTVLTNSFLVLFTTIFLLLELSTLPAKLRFAFDGGQRPLVLVRRFLRSFNKYLVIKTAISLVTGTLAAVWCALLGVQYPLLWGTLAFLLNYVPNIGSIVAAVPPIFLGLVQGSIGLGLLVAIGYLVINMVLGNIIEPRVMGEGMGLSTLVVFLSLVFWGWVLGSVGMLLSVPLTMVVKLALESRAETKWLALLLSSDRRIRSATAHGLRPRTGALGGERLRTADATVLEAEAPTMNG